MSSYWLCTEEDYDKFFINRSPDWLQRHTGDPVAKNEEGLYFFVDEVWHEMYGPFRTLEECDEALEKYNNSL